MAGLEAGALAGACARAVGARAGWGRWQGRGPRIALHAQGSGRTNALCALVYAQEDIIAAGGVPALVRLLGLGSPGAQGHAAEVLVALAGVDEHRKRLIVRCAQLPGVLLPLALAWYAVLLDELLVSCNLLAFVRVWAGAGKGDACVRAELTRPATALPSHWCWPARAGPPPSSHCCSGCCSRRCQ